MEELIKKAEATVGPIKNLFSTHEYPDDQEP